MSDKLNILEKILQTAAKLVPQIESLEKEGIRIAGEIDHLQDDQRYFRDQMQLLSQELAGVRREQAELRERLARAESAVDTASETIQLKVQNALLKGVSVVPSADIIPLAPKQLLPPSQGRLTRSCRVSVSPTAAQIGDATCEMKNLSATGALLLVKRRLPLQTEWTLRFKSGNPKPAELKVRVARIDPLESGDNKTFTTGVLFCTFPPQARQFIEKLCGRRFSETES